MTAAKIDPVVAISAGCSARQDVTKRQANAVGEGKLLDAVVLAPRGDEHILEGQPVVRAGNTEDQIGRADGKHFDVGRHDPSRKPHTVQFRGAVTTEVEDPILAVSAGEVIGIGAVSPFEQVVALATREDVATGAALQPIIARPSIEIDSLG